MLVVNPAYEDFSVMGEGIGIIRQNGSPMRLIHRLAPMLKSGRMEAWKRAIPWTNHSGNDCCILSGYSRGCSYE